MRIDESFRNELRESHATIQELTSQIQELQERMNYLSDSKRISRCTIDYSGKSCHVPSQLAIVPSLRADV